MLRLSKRGPPFFRRDLLTEQDVSLPVADADAPFNPREATDRVRKDLVLRMDGMVKDIERHAEIGRRDIAELARANLLDKDDEVEFVVPATDRDREIAVPHRLPRAPKRWAIVFQSDFGTLKPARKQLADERNLYFQTDAAKGTVFRVIPALGKE